MAQKNIFFNRFIRTVLALVFVGGLMFLPHGSVRATGATLVVDTLTDNHDSNTGDGYCNTAGNCSLRAALEQAAVVSSVSNPVTIHFSSGLYGQTIYPSNSLSSYLLSGDYITLDGESSQIAISGSLLGSSFPIIYIYGNHNAVRYLSFHSSHYDGIQLGDLLVNGNGNYNVLQYLKVYGNGRSGIYITGSTTGGAYNEIRDSYIGSDEVATACSAAVSNTSSGIAIYGGTNTLVSGNTIDCNLEEGIAILGLHYINGTIVENNYIGTDMFNHTGFGNTHGGVYVGQDLSTTIRNNVISGNGDDGILLDIAIDTSILGNKIGTNSSGNAAIPNGRDGIRMTRTTGVHIGSSTDATGMNLISGNTACGVNILSSSYANVLDGNWIGLALSGTAAIPNGLAGVAIDGAPNNTLSTYGGTVLPQFIAGNTREGVYIKNSDGTLINSATYIGVGSGGGALGNGLEGIKLDTGSTNTFIYARTVANNAGAGIAVVGNTSTSNFFLPTHIYSNGGLAIDLGDDGHTGNGDHVPPGPNNWQNYPVATVATSNGFYGQTCAYCMVYFYEPVGNPLQNGGGGTYINDYVTADSSGVFLYTFPVDFFKVSMIACDGTNNCSEMSQAYPNPAVRFVYLPLVKR